MADMKKVMKQYKECLTEVMMEKYNMSEFEVKKMLKIFDFESYCQRCNYYALHDDPDDVAERIYNWMNNTEELQEM